MSRVVVLLALLSACSNNAYQCEVTQHSGRVVGEVVHGGITGGIPVTLQQGDEVWEVAADGSGRFDVEVDDGSVLVWVGDETGSVTWRLESWEAQESSSCSEVRAESCDAEAMLFRAEGCEHLD